MSRFLAELGESYEAVIRSTQRERVQLLEVASATLDVLDTISIAEVAKEQGKTLGGDSNLNTHDVLANQPKLDIAEVARQQGKAIAGDSAQVTPVEPTIPYDMSPFHADYKQTSDVIHAKQLLDEAYKEHVPPKVDDWSNN